VHTTGTAGGYDWDNKKAPLDSSSAFLSNRVCKPGSVLTAIYLVLQLLAGSSRLLEAIGQIYALLHGVAAG